MAQLHGASGVAVEVDGRNRLQTHAESLEEAGAIVRTTGRSFIFSSATFAAPVATVTTAATLLLLIRNDSTELSLVIDASFASSNTAGTRLLMQVNGSLGVLANNETIAPRSLNLSSGLLSNSFSTAYRWDGIGAGITGYTAGAFLDSRILGAGASVLPFDGTIVLGKNNILALYAAAPTTTSSVAVSVRGYYV